MPKSNKELALQLLEQILEVSASLDARSASEAPPDQPNGDGWVTFHLRQVKELLEDD